MAVGVVASVVLFVAYMLVETVKLVFKGVEWITKAFGNLLIHILQPVLDNAPAEEVEDILEDVPDIARDSSNFKNSYETFGGPGEDLMYAIYEEYGIE